MAKGLAGTSLFSDANLVSYWKLEDTSDSKGSNTLTNNGSGSFNAAHFDNGYDQGTANATKYLSVASNLGIAGNGDISISFWLKLNAEIASGVWTLANHNSTTTADRYIDIEYQYNAGSQKFQIDMAGTSFSYSIILGTTNFYHIVLTRNVSGNAGILYVNNSNVASGTLGSGTNAANRFSIGAFNAGGNISVACLFDDIAVFSKVLSPTEVTTIYNSPITNSAGGFLMNFF